MTTSISVCGLIVLPGVEPYAWQTALYWHELAEPHAGVAVDFTRAQVLEEGYSVGYPNAVLLGAAVHPRHVERCGGIDFADVPVDGDDELERHSDTDLYTVCGIYLDNGETYCDEWVEYGPKMAYLAAWNCARDNGREFLVACVHHGSVERLDGLTFADPACNTEDESRSSMMELIGGNE